MRPARTPLAALAAVALLALCATPAAARSLSVSPKVGDAASTFVFKGKQWRPGSDVQVEYYESGAADEPFKTFVIVTRANGRFTFRFIRPVNSVEIGLTPTMCFTEFSPSRRVTRCKRFFVEPPTARFWPSAGPPGTAFLLMTSGWYPGMRVVLDLTRPDGITETYTDMSPTRTRGAYFGFGSPFGSVFVRKGATYRLFPENTTVLVGDYLATVRQANGDGAVIRTLVTITPP